jgi:16S rRNA (cytosine967-C5)-methyltransferase
VPCSATGVIRRHPDIKFLRLPEDIAQLQALQLQILHRLWTTLKPKGILLYATCSILPDENVEVIRQFCSSVDNCDELPIDIHCGIPQTYGRQLFPQTAAHDGFYYAKLQKRDDSLI